jgi:hypothetical protein
VTGFDQGLLNLGSYYVHSVCPKTSVITVTVEDVS